VNNFKDENLDRISHHIKSLSKDMYEIKNLIKDKEKVEKELSKRDTKRRKSLRKAQKKFKNVSTNLKSDVYKKFQERALELKTTKSNYLKNLILKDLGIKKAINE